MRAGKVAIAQHERGCCDGSNDDERYVNKQISR